MIRDRLYTEIVEALERLRDGDLFEVCACDLLRDAYPALSPVQGGQDDGVDGTFGEDGVLICTVRDDVIGNLTGSLNRHRDAGGSRRRVLLATSVNLTPRRKQNLERRVAELGFTLVQVFDQPAFALRLWRDERWRLELLGIAGDPDALSDLPPRPPVADVPLIGRQGTLDWLRASGADRVLVGGPGSGKTAVLAEVAKSINASFLTTNGETRIANALRAHSPRCVIVDDAHSHLGQLCALLRLRSELRLTFEVIAATWSGARDTVAAALQIVDDAHIHALPELTRDELVEVVRGMGINVDQHREAVRRIVDQAQNQPGLAVTLCQAALQGGLQDVLTGRSLWRYVSTWLAFSADSNMKVLLAAFALGGRTGMNPGTVADLLRVPLDRFHEQIEMAAAAGLLRETERSHLAIRPRALRGILVTEVFFSRANLDHRPFMEIAPSKDDAIETLLWSAHSGGSVPFDEIRAHLLAGGARPSLWASFASLGANEARWVLENLQASNSQVDLVLLYRIPDEVLPRLLERASLDDGDSRSTPEEPFHSIRTWARDLRPPAQELIGRRRLLVQAARAFHLSGGALSVAVRAACEAVSPDVEETGSDPGRGHTITFTHGVLPAEALQELQELWPEVRELAACEPGAGWKHLLDALWHWEHPGSSGPPVSVDDARSDLMRAMAVRIVRDLAAIVCDRPGLLAIVRQHAEGLGIDLDVGLPLEFSTLFPPDRDSYMREEVQLSEAVRALADRWVSERPNVVVERIRSAESEAAAGGISWPRMTPSLCTFLAERTSEPGLYIAEMSAAGLAPDLVDPFLRKLEGAERAQVLRTLLASERYLYIALSSALGHQETEEALRRSALELVAPHPHLVEILVVQNRVPEEILLKLMRHSDPLVAYAAASSEWMALERGAVRENLREAFREAVLRTASDTEGSRLNRSHVLWDLRSILGSDSELAFEWLSHWLRNGEALYSPSEGSVQEAALAALTADQRRKLLEHEKLSRAGWTFFGLLVGEDLELYSQLLGDRRFEKYHLAPLAGHPEGIWVEKAKLARARGLSADAIAEATLPSSFGWVGSEAAYWRTWVEKFQALRRENETELNEVADAGVRLYEERARRAVHRDRFEELHGLNGDD